MIPRIWIEGYKYGKCLVQSWLEPVRGRGMGKERKTTPDNQNGPCLPPPVSLPTPVPLPSLSLWLALVKYEPNISRIYTSQLNSWVSLLRSTRMKIERIESSETSAIKPPTPGDYPENTIRQIWICYTTDVESHLFWQSSGTCFSKDILQRTPKPI